MKNALKNKLIYLFFFFLVFIEIFVVFSFQFYALDIFFVWILKITSTLASNLIDSLLLREVFNQRRDTQAILNLIWGLDDFKTNNKLTT